MNTKSFRSRLNRLPCLPHAAVLLAALVWNGLAFCVELQPKASFNLLGGVTRPDAVVFSPDLKWAATKRASGKVQVWDVEKGESVAEWSTGEEETNPPLSPSQRPAQIAFHADAPQLLVASGTNLTLRDLFSGRIEHQFEPSPGRLLGLVESAAGNRVAALAEKTHSNPSVRELVFWSLPDGKIIPRLPTSHFPWELGRPAVNMRFGTPFLPISMNAGICRALSPDGARFAVGHERAQVDAWNLEGIGFNHYLATVSGPGAYGVSTSGRAEALAFLDNQRLAVVYNRERLDVLTLNTNDAQILQCLPRIPFTAKTADGNSVTGAVVALQNYQARVQIEQMGFTPITVGSDSERLRNFHYQVTNATSRTGWLVVATVQATNNTDAAAQFKNRGFENGRVIEGQEDILAVESRERALQETLNQHPEWGLLTRRQTLIGSPGLEIRGLAVSGDGRRLAVAGMRMAWRPGFFAPKGDGVYDSPVNAEIQIWDAVGMKLLTTIKGRADEKFGSVALNQTGGSLAAVTTGVHYSPNETGAMQQDMELRPTGPWHVYLWNLP